MPAQPNNRGTAHLAATVLDTQSSLESRRSAVESLISADPIAARTVLLRAASDETDDEVYLRFVGRTLGILAIEQGYLSEWELRDISDPSYEEYNELYRPPRA